MGKVTIDDPDEYRKEISVDSRGRVTIGREHAGKTVNVTVEVVEGDE